VTELLAEVQSQLADEVVEEVGTRARNLTLETLIRQLLDEGG